MNLLEKENIRLEQDIVRMTDRETDLNNAIISLKENMVIMERELESSMRMRERLKDSMIDVIDRNERLGLRRTSRPRSHQSLLRKNLK